MRAKKKIAIALGVALILPAFLLVTEFTLRRFNYSLNSRDPAGSTILFYTDRLERSPDKTVSFRLYGPDATLLEKADFELNNMGLFSTRDYSYTRGENEYRIVVVGGEQTASSVADISWPDFLEDELNQQDRSKNYKVFNIAWPDAGPEHYVQYWESDGKKFDADLVIVNFPETDFYRGAVQVTAPMLYRGQRTELSPLSYRIGPGEDDIATTIVPHVVGTKVSSFRDMNAIPSRPYGFFASRAFIDDQSRVRRLQQMIVDDMINGSASGWLISRPFRGAWPIYSVWDERWFDPLPSAPRDKQAMVDMVGRAFTTLIEKTPNVIFIHNFNGAERHTRHELSAALTAQYQDIKIVDMRDLIPKGTSEDEFKSWFLASMQEKWSNLGHRVYARLVTQVVLADRSSRAKQKPMSTGPR